MAVHTLPVEVKPDHLQRLISSRNPVAAIGELIWNSLDADATTLAVAIDRSILSAVERIVVADNGRGMPYEEACEAFGSLGGSRKRTREKTHGGRIVHGKLGKGRFRAFSLGSNVLWETTTQSNAKVVRYSIRGDRDRLSAFEVEDPEEASTSATGTTVTITGSEGTLPALETAKAVQELTGEFALYLRQYPEVLIRYNGVLINPASIEHRVTNYPLPIIKSEHGEEIEAELTIIEWTKETERALLLCDRHGFALAQVPARIHAPGFNFTAYLRSDFIRQADQDGTLALEGLNSDLQLLIGEGRLVLRRHFRERQAEAAAALVETWKEEKIYPYSGSPTSIVEEAERQVFDVVALNIHSYMPEFDSTDTESKRLTFRLLRQAVTSDASSLQTILHDVVRLPQDKQDELAKLLKRTSLARIISASKLVADRLDFLRSLEILVFDKDSQKELKERSQLHRIVAEHTWLFGEEYALAVDDQSLTEVLRAHLGSLGIELLEDKPVLREDGSTGIVDLMLSRAIPQPHPDSREHLVVELKRPNVSIGKEEFDQVERYAYAVINDPRFKHTSTRWHFWAVSTDISPFVQDKARQPLKPDGLVTEFDNGRTKVWVKSWGQIIDESKARLRFVQEKLSYNADKSSALDYLREAYDRYLPPSLKIKSVA